jgi:hypothetical protein
MRFIIATLALLASSAHADDKQAKLLGDERAAYETAKPAFEKYCAGCHTQGGKQATARSSITSR